MSTPTTGVAETTHHVVSSLLRKEEPDQYGQRHPIETDEMIRSSLSLLDEQMETLPPEERTGLDRAMETCPDLVESEEHRIMFLRCEQFNADMAAKRLANYWNQRIELFGDEQAFSEKLTLDGALKDDRVALDLGFATLLPGTDPKGRAIVFLDPSQLDATQYTRESMNRATWYVLHAALESKTAQQKGVVFLAFLRDTEYKHFDVPLVRMGASSLKGCLPIRVSAIHICQPPMLFDVLYDLVMMVLGERLSRRVKLYSRRNEELVLLEEMAEYGLTRDILPTKLGGLVALDHGKWLEDRRASEK